MVVELIGPVGVRLLTQLTGCLDHVQDQLLGGESSFAFNESQLCTQRCHVIQLLLAESIGADDLKRIAFGDTDQCKRCPGAATGVLNDRVSGLQPTILLCPRNHGMRHPIFHTTGGILPLELNEDISTIGWNELAKSNHRCVSNGMENFHGLSSPLCWLVF